MAGITNKRKLSLLLCTAVLAAAAGACSAQGAQPRADSSAPTEISAPTAASVSPAPSPSQSSAPSAPPSAAPGADSGAVTADGARDIALAHAGLTAQEVTGLRVEQEHDHGQTEYDIEFWCGTIEYDYTVRASDGAILKQERDIHGGGALPAPSASGAASYIGEDAAQDCALNHAGLSAADTGWLRCWLEYDDGVPECYEVEFAASGTRYEYKIGLYDGAVLKYEAQSWSGGHHTAPPSAAPAPAGTQSGLIGLDAARDIALRHAGVSLDAAYGLEVELDQDDGRTIYQVEFKAGGMEYEYELDAQSGDILKYESEHD